MFKENWIFVIFYNPCGLRWNSVMYVIGLHFSPFDFTYQFLTWLPLFVNHGRLYIFFLVQLILENLRSVFPVEGFLFLMILIIKCPPFHIQVLSYQSFVKIENRSSEIVGGL